MKVVAPLLLLFVLLSCSCNSIHVSKRHYRSGFYIDRANCSLNANSRSENAEREISDHGKHALDQTQDATFAANDSVVAAENSSVPVKSGTKCVDSTQVQPEENKTGVIVSPENSKQTPDEPDPVNRQIAITKILGVMAIALLLVGLIMLEFSAFAIPLVLIGIGCAFIGLKIGKTALQNTRQKKRSADGKERQNEKRQAAKRAYGLCLGAILGAMAYVLIRFVIIAGPGIITLAFALLGICLILFLLFKWGVFSDLAD